jgi:uncharacterized protein HemY
LWHRGKKKTATDAFRRAEAAWKKVTVPTHLKRDRDRAWFLATCPDLQFCKPDEAVVLAEKASALSPKDPLVSRTLGVALLRAGKYDAATKALEQGMKGCEGGGAVDWFYLAMAQHGLGEKTKARQRFDLAVAWAQKHRPRDPDLTRLRAEAAQVLGLGEKMPPAGQTKPR